MKIVRALALCSALLAPAAQAQPMEDVPFVTTPDNVTLAMLEIAKVGPSDYVIDLGSGDGRIVIVAAKKFGARGLGVELVPALVKESRATAEKSGVAKRVEFREQDLFQTDLSTATVVTLYLLPVVNMELRPKILALKPGTRVVSHDWDMGDWKPDRTIVVPAPDKKIGLEKSSTVHFWQVPASFQGTWCGLGAADGTRFELKQAFQEFSGHGNHGKSTRPVQGRIEGRTLRSSADGPHYLVMEHEGDAVKVSASGGRWQPFNGTTFRRASDRNTC